MTSTPSPFITMNKRGPLHFLAYVALDAQTPDDCPSNPSPSATGIQNTPRLSYETPPYTFSSSPGQCVPSLHISCGRPPSDAGSEPTPLIRSTSTSSTLPSESAPVQSRHNMKTRKKCSTRDSPIHGRAKEETLARRRERLERATKIRSLDNSPVNDEQLTVLRMVYDEITMYPSESWMVLIAIIIRRSFKQVKNWFSNERQKNRVGEMVSVYTEEGDKMRLRLKAFEFSEQWSDCLIEEVAMVYHYLVTQSYRRKKQRLSDQRESSRVMKPDGHSSRSLD